MVLRTTGEKNLIASPSVTRQFKVQNGFLYLYNIKENKNVNRKSY